MYIYIYIYTLCQVCGTGAQGWGAVEERCPKLLLLIIIRKTRAMMFPIRTIIIITTTTTTTTTTVIDVVIVIVIVNARVRAGVPRHRGSRPAERWNQACFKRSKRRSRIRGSVVGRRRQVLREPGHASGTDYVQPAWEDKTRGHGTSRVTMLASYHTLSNVRGV